MNEKILEKMLETEEGRLEIANKLLLPWKRNIAEADVIFKRKYTVVDRVKEKED